MVKITATYYIYNAVDYDYPIVQSIRALRPMVDEIVVLDCGSKDSTKELVSKEDVLLFDAPEWKVDRGEVNDRDWFYQKIAREKSKADWYIRMDSDEIIVESYTGALRDAVEKANVSPCVNHVGCNRLNFYLSPDTYIKLRHKTPPCGTYQYRVCRAGTKAWGDSLNYDFVKDGMDAPGFYINHYGYLREPKAFIKKAKEYELLSYGKTAITDSFKPTDLYTLEDMEYYLTVHPEEIQTWLKERFGNERHG